MSCTTFSVSIIKKTGIKEESSKTSPNCVSFISAKILIFFLFITYFWIWKMSKTICATSGAGTSYPTGAREFISVVVVFMKLNK